MGFPFLRFSCLRTHTIHHLPSVFFSSVVRTHACTSNSERARHLPRAWPRVFLWSIRARALASHVHIDFLFGFLGRAGFSTRLGADAFSSWIFISGLTLP